MAELEACGFELLMPPWEGQKFQRLRRGPACARPALIKEIEERIGEAVAWLKRGKTDKVIVKPTVRNIWLDSDEHQSGEVE
jgi:hypothetical protein